MNTENVEITDDEVTKELNRRLNEEAKADKLNEAVEKKLTEHREAEAKRKKALEVHDATFTDETDKKKKKIITKTKIECYYCGSEDLEKYTDDDNIYIYKGTDIAEGYRCNNCGRKTGVAK